MATSSSCNASPQHYELSPLHPVFGAAVSGIILAPELEPEVVQQIRADLHEHKLLVFRGQGNVSAETQLAVSRWFGSVESTFFKHKRSPHPDIFRVSNDEQEGCTQVGRSGWHIDGSFLSTPFKVQTMTFWAVSKSGSTLFSPLGPAIDRLSPPVKAEWERLHYVANSADPNTGGPVVHPLVYPHPVTGEHTLCFHCGSSFVRSFAVNLSQKPDGNRAADDDYSTQRTAQLLDDITHALESEEICYGHDWQLGDFAIIDNLAVGHYAHPDTQESTETNGLRILHRTTVAGTSRPSKGP
jgi:alpha-ketoglutarate-dependent taurine dioxygenase